MDRKPGFVGAEPGCCMDPTKDVTKAKTKASREMKKSAGLLALPFLLLYVRVTGRCLISEKKMPYATF